jgi:serine/threonine protein kinase
MNDITTELAYLENESASYQDIERNGQAAEPLAFAPAEVGVAVRVDALILDPSTGKVIEGTNIIYEHHADGKQPSHGYWVQRKLKKCIFGVVKSCIILKLRPGNVEIPWEITNRQAAVKIMSWRKIQELRHVEDPQKEVAAMQFISRYGIHPHVMGTLDVLQDSEYLLMFMPFCSNGDLFSYVQKASRFEEHIARIWFKQILEVSTKTCCSPLPLCSSLWNHRKNAYPK